ncbi:phosphatase [Vibrio phage BONAISHI]|nr:phosphatase [Vibrio phage BONAISHI]
MLTEVLIQLEPGILIKEHGYGTTIVSRVLDYPVKDSNGNVKFKAKVVDSDRIIDYVAGGTYGPNIEVVNRLNFKDGDIFKFYNEHDVFIHQANCQCRIKSGVAKGVSIHMPELVEADNLTIKGDPRKLGTFSTATINDTICINLYGQFYYGTDEVQTDYAAISRALKAIGIMYRGLNICMPKIGSGLAGGHWPIIQDLINIHLRHCSVTVYCYEEESV